MANKRDYKKYISAVRASICEYMMDVCTFVPGVNEEEINKAIIAVLTAGEAAVIKANVKFDKSQTAFPDGGYSKARRSFYKALYSKTNKEFSDAVNAAIKIFNAAVPAEVKDQNKKLLQG